MNRMITAAVTLTLFASVVPASAADPDPAATERTTPVVMSAASVASAAPLLDEIDWSQPTVHFGSPRRGAVLPALYVSLAGLHTFDAYSTLKGVSKGAVESNPLMRGAARNSTAVWAIKAGVTGATIGLAERLWRDNKRGQAIALLVVSNGVMAAVAARNASVLRQQQR